MTDTDQPSTPGRPLDGLVVADLTRFHPGGYLTRILADLGAEVVRLEDPNGSAWRRPSPGDDYIWVTLGHSTRSLAVDLRHERAPEVMARLAPAFDIVVESHPLGRLDEMGMGYRQLSAVNPRLIWCSLSAWGLTSPYADRGGHEINFLAHTGVLDLLTPQGTVPNQPPLLLAASQGALWGAIGVLAALERRHHTGRGELIDASITDAAMWLMSQDVTRAHQGHDPWALDTPGRTSYRCSDDRWIAAAAIEPRTWKALCAGLGLDDLAEPVEGPPDAVDEVRARIATAFAAAPAAHWMEKIPDANLTVLHEVGDLADDPHVRATGGIVEMPRGDRTEHIVTLPLRFPAGEDPADHVSPPPDLGEANAALFARAGLAGTELDEFRASGVFGPEG